MNRKHSVRKPVKRVITIKVTQKPTPVRMVPSGSNTLPSAPVLKNKHGIKRIVYG